MNWELSDVQAGFRKDRGSRDKIVNIHWIIEKAREFQRKSKSFDGVEHNRLWNIPEEMKTSDHLTFLLRKSMQDKKQQIELNMEQWTDFKLGKENIKAVYIITLFI